MKSNKKQAILIMAHNNIFTLEKILTILDSDFFDFYIHIDKKSNIEINDINRNLCKKSKVHIYKEIDIRWADYSQVDAELLLLSKSIEDDYSYYHLISGNDMPIKTAKEIYEFYNKSNKEFVHFASNEIAPKKISWIKYYHIFMKKLRNNYFYIILDKLCVIIQKLLFINRLKDNYKYMTGANWFSITRELANYVLENEDNIKKMYKYTRSSDEVFLQTLVENSSFKDNLYNKDYNDNYDSCKRYIKWDGNVPYVFKKDDLNELINSNMFFARKFDEKIDKEIIQLLYDQLK